MDKLEVIEKLQGYDRQIEELWEAIYDRSRDNAELRSMLKALKRSLDEDFKLRDTVKGDNAMSEVERDYFFPAILEAVGTIDAPASSLPGDEWTSQLYSAQISIRFYLNQLMPNTFVFQSRPIVEGKWYISDVGKAHRADGSGLLETDLVGIKGRRLGGPFETEEAAKLAKRTLERRVSSFGSGVYVWQAK